MGQEDKPRTAIVAEILAHGYKLSDDVAKRAIDLDSKHGLSDRFKGYLSNLDRSLSERLVKGTSNEPLTGKTEGIPSGPAAAESVTDKNAQATPLPGTGPFNQDKLTTTVPAPDAQAEVEATQGSSQQPSFVKHVQGKVQSQLDRPEVKAKTDFAWSKMQEVSVQCVYARCLTHRILTTYSGPFFPISTTTPWQTSPRSTSSIPTPAGP